MTDLPGLQFDLGEDIAMLRSAVQAFAASEIAPRAAEIDRSDQFPMDLWPKLGKLGLHGITVGEAYGGTDLGYLAHIVALEEVSRASASVRLSYGAHSNLCINQIHRNGTAAQKARYLPGLVAGSLIGALAMSEPGAGSDVMSMRLRAERRGSGASARCTGSRRRSRVPARRLDHLRQGVARRRPPQDLPRPVQRQQGGWRHRQWRPLVQSLMARMQMGLWQRKESFQKPPLIDRWCQDP